MPLKIAALRAEALQWSAGPHHLLGQNEVSVRFSVGRLGGTSVRLPLDYSLSGHGSGGVLDAARESGTDDGGGERDEGTSDAGNNDGRGVGLALGRFRKVRGMAGDRLRGETERVKHSEGESHSFIWSDEADGGLLEEDDMAISAAATASGNLDAAHRPPRMALGKEGGKGAVTLDLDSRLAHDTGYCLKIDIRCHDVLHTHKIARTYVALDTVPQHSAGDRNDVGEVDNCAEELEPRWIPLYPAGKLLLTMAFLDGPRGLKKGGAKSGTMVACDAQSIADAAAHGPQIERFLSSPTSRSHRAASNAIIPAPSVSGGDRTQMETFHSAEIAHLQVWAELPAGGAVREGAVIQGSVRYFKSSPDPIVADAVVLLFEVELLVHRRKSNKGLRSIMIHSKKYAVLGQVDTNNVTIKGGHHHWPWAIQAPGKLPRRGDHDDSGRLIHQVNLRFSVTIARRQGPNKRARLVVEVSK